MPECDDHDANNGIYGLASVMRQAERASHNAEAKGSDHARHHKAVLANADPEGERADDHRQCQSHFVENGLSKEPTSGGQQPQQHGGRYAMDDAKARKAHRYAIKPPDSERQLRHERDIGESWISYNISSAPIERLPLGLWRAKRPSP